MVRAFRGMNRQLTYGELTINGIEELLKNLQINKDDVFIDVGSGYGKLVEIINQKVGCKTIGIEIDTEKYNISSKIIQNKKAAFIKKQYGDIKTLEALAEDEIEVDESESLEEIKAKLKPKKASISLDMLDTANTYDDKVVLMRLLVQEDEGKVALVLKNMMKNG